MKDCTSGKLVQVGTACNLRKTNRDDVGPEIWGASVAAGELVLIICAVLEKESQHLYDVFVLADEGYGWIVNRLLHEVGRL